MMRPIGARYGEGKRVSSTTTMSPARAPCQILRRQKHFIEEARVERDHASPARIDLEPPDDRSSCVRSST